MSTRYINPAFLNNGMVVYVDCRVAGIHDQKPGTGLRCMVVAAHGDHGMVENEAYDFRRLMSRWDMWVPAAGGDVVPGHS